MVLVSGAGGERVSAAAVRLRSRNGSRVRASWTAAALRDLHAALISSMRRPACQRLDRVHKARA